MPSRRILVISGEQRTSELGELRVERAKRLFDQVCDSLFVLFASLSGCLFVGKFLHQVIHMCPQKIFLWAAQKSNRKPALRVHHLSIVGGVEGIKQGIRIRHKQLLMGVKRRLLQPR